MRGREAFPDAQDVGKQAQRHARVLGALVFEEEVKECVGFREFEREEQIAFGRGEVRIDKG